MKQRIYSYRGSYGETVVWPADEKHFRCVAAPSSTTTNQRKKGSMKRQQFAEFVLTHAKARFIAENERATGDKSAIAPLDPQVEEIKAFLATQPFGCHSEKARQFAEKVTGKHIPGEAAKASRYLQRLRVRVITADSNSHEAPEGQAVLSLDRKGHVVWPQTHPDGSVDLITHLPRVLKSDARRATPDEGNRLFAQLDTLTEPLGNVLMEFSLEDLCELVK